MSLAARQVGGGKQTRQVSETGKTNPDAAQAPPLRSELETRGRLAYHLLGLHGNVPISRPVTNHAPPPWGKMCAQLWSLRRRALKLTVKPDPALRQDPAMNHVVIAEAKGPTLFQEDLNMSRGVGHSD